MKQKGIKWVNRIKIILAAFVLVCGLGNTMQAEAATQSQKKAFRQELLDIFMKQDNTARDISQYNLTRNEFYEEYEKFQKEEGLMIYSAYPYSPDYSITGSMFRIKTFTLKCTDAGVKNRYNKMCAAVDEIRAGIEPEMTDLDKILYLHDCVVERTTYGGGGDQIYVAGGALGEGRAVCMGYAYALNMLLKLEGFEQSYARSESLHHGWTYVKLDGEWYHIDPTWDDTRSPKSGQTSRVHFLKNDLEFKKNHGSDLYALDTSEPSTSTKYSTWFLRSVVGEMIFEDGYWYYYDSSADAVVRASLEKNFTEEIIDCSKTGGERIKEVNGEVITLQANGYTYKLKAGDEIIESEGVDEFLCLSEIDLNDFNNWISGMYHHQTGIYTADGGRICLKNYVKCDGGVTYNVEVSNGAYQVLVRELNANQSMVVSHNLTSGSSFTTNASTKYLAISIYSPSVSNMTYEKYESLFANGFTVGIGKEVVADSVTPEVDTEVSEGEDATVGSGSVQGIDLNDFDNWMSGVYHHQTGLYTEDSGRICLKDYVSCMSGAEYFVSISNTKYNVLIREMDAKGALIASHNLTDRNSFTTKDNTVSLAISIYAPNIWNMTYEKYEALFADGLTVFIALQEREEVIVPEEEEEIKDESAALTTVEEWDFRDFSNWQTGMYHYSTGKFCTYSERICLKEYLEFSSKVYVADITDATYKILVRELDENYKFIKSVTVANGNVYTPSENAKYLAISLYNATNDWGMSYAKFRQMFADGFYAELVAK